jgi:hypothetical protein
MALSLHSAAPSRSNLVGRRIAIFDAHPVVKIAIETAFRKAGAVVVSGVDAQFEAAVIGLGVSHQGIVEPIARSLHRREIPFLFYEAQSEVDLESIRLAWPSCRIVTRPASPAEIVQAAVWLF